MSKVYSNEPIPKELTNEESKFIIGAQAYVWAEFIPNIEVAEFMLFPRIFAFLEVGWTPRYKRDYSNFELRMGTEYSRLDMYGVNSELLTSFNKNKYLRAHYREQKKR